MEKRVSIRDIAEMHLSQQLERKKALLLNLELDGFRGHRRRVFFRWKTAAGMR